MKKFIPVIFAVSFIFVCAQPARAESLGRNITAGVAGAAVGCSAGVVGGAAVSLVGNHGLGEVIPLGIKGCYIGAAVGGVAGVAISEAAAAAPSEEQLAEESLSEE